MYNPLLRTYDNLTVTRATGLGKRLPSPQWSVGKFPQGFWSSQGPRYYLSLYAVLRNLPSYYCADQDAYFLLGGKYHCRQA